jgi:ribonuclease P protein component|tara:strand:- start:474 stop:815 length:342 start_codon:yes stop_codon:yes gene_type:complete
MSIKLLSLSKNEDFKTLLTGKKISNKYLTIFFKNLSDKSNKNLNISFVTQKKLGNAVKRNKIKRKLRNIMNQILTISKINLNYSYLLIAKKNIIDAKFFDIKETILKDYKKIK